MLLHSYENGQNLDHQHQQVLVKVWSIRNVHSLLMGMQNGTATLEDSLAFPYKTKRALTIWSSNCTSGLQFINNCHQLGRSLERGSPEHLMWHSESMLPPWRWFIFPRMHSIMLGFISWGGQGEFGVGWQKTEDWEKGLRRQDVGN